jgi:hypothetical protein
MARAATSTAEIIELEERFWEAAGDPRFYEEHFADDGTIALPIGMMDKAAVVEAMRSAEPWTGFEFSEPSLIDIADDVAAVTYTASAVREDGDEYQAAVSSVYVRRNGSWKLVIHQQTPLS